MDSAFLQKLLSYVQPSSGIAALSAKIYYADTVGHWLNSPSKIGAYTDKSTGVNATALTGLDSCASNTVIDWGSVLGSQWDLIFLASSTQFGGSGLRGCAYGASTYVAVAADGKVATSPDGFTWTSQTGALGTDEHTDVAFLNSQFVATGFNGKIATSPDGVTWTLRTSGFGTTVVRGVAYGGGVYVAVGGSGKVSTSSDAITWTAQTPIFGGADVNGIAFGGGLFVAVGASGNVSTSPNGITWTSRTTPFSSGFTTVRGAGYASGLYAAVGNGGIIATSPDAITWTQQTNPNTNHLYRVGKTLESWVAVGDNGDILTSPDAVTWTSWQSVSPFYTSGPVIVRGFATNGVDIVGVGDVGSLAVSQKGAFEQTTTVAGVVVDVAGTGSVGSLLPASDASTPTYTIGTPPPAVAAGDIQISYGGNLALLGTYVGDKMIDGLANGIAADPGYLTTAATCRLLSSYTSPTSFTEITTAQYSSYARQACSISVTGSTMSNTGSLFFTIYGSSPTAPTITHAAIFDNLDRVIMCLPLPTPIARTDYIRDITIAAGAMQLNLNPTQTSTPV